MSTSGTVKFFNNDKGFGFITPTTEAATYSCTFPR